MVKNWYFLSFMSRDIIGHVTWRHYHSLTYDYLVTWHDIIIMCYYVDTLSRDMKLEFCIKLTNKLFYIKSRDYHVTKGLTIIFMIMMENNLFSKTFLSTHNHSNFIILSWPHFKSFWSENWVPRLIFDEEHDAEVRKLLSLLVLAV